MSLTLILPTLNEADSLRLLLPRLLAECERLSVLLVVDDRSTDGTDAVVRELARDDPRLRLVLREGPPCLTAAIQAGIDLADTPLVGWMDADGSMDPADVDRLCAAVEAGAELAVGSRFAATGRMKGQRRDGLLGRLQALAAVRHTADPWLGVALSWGLNCVLLPLLLRSRPHDFTSGFAVARRAIFTPLRLRGDYGEYFIDLWRQARAQGLRVHEVGYAITPRQSGSSKTATSLGGYLRRGPGYLAAALRPLPRS